MSNRTDARKQFLTDILTTAVEGGINYWAQVSDYKWDCPLGEATVTVWEIEESTDGAGDEYPDTYKPYVVTLDTIAHGIAVLLELRKGWGNETYWHQFRIANRTNGQDGDYDSITADDILQAGALGELVYG